MRLFDTDLLVAGLRGDPPARRAILSGDESGWTTTLNAAELYEGAALSNRPEPERDAVEELLRQLRLVPFGPRAARRYGAVAAELWSRGAYPGLMDVLIAAIAVAEDATLVTRNRKHFAGIPGLRLEAW